MAGCVKDLTRELTELDHLIVREQLVKLGTIALEVVPQVEEGLEHRLHLDDMLAYRGLGTCLFCEISGSGEMVGVDVRLPDPCGYCWSCLRPY